MCYPYPVVSEEPRQLRLEEAPPPPPRSRATAANGRTPRSRPPTATKLLTTPGALLTRSHLRQLGLERRAIDAVFRKLPVVSLPGYSRPMVRAEQYLQLLEQHTYHDDRVRPARA
jgi:hypothetical protein